MMILTVHFATTESARIVMQLSSVTDVTWQCTKIAMGYHLSQKDNGYVDDVYLVCGEMWYVDSLHFFISFFCFYFGVTNKISRAVFSVRTSLAHSSRPIEVIGPIFSARSGSRKSVSAIRSIWNQSKALSVYRVNDGNLSAISANRKPAHVFNA